MVYVITHKKFTFHKADGYEVLQVGAAEHPDLGYLKDNTGDNISSKNTHYCELTGLYWIWKNRRDTVKGLVHYRRYFSMAFSNHKFLSQQQIGKILKKYDVILPYYRTLNVSVRQQYCRNSGLESDLNKLQRIIHDLEPEYERDYIEMLNGNQTYFFNMLIADRKVFDDYCAWLFRILFEFEKTVDYSQYNNYQQRIYGFLSERLLTLYFRHNHFKIFEMSVIETENKYPLIKDIVIRLKRCFYPHIKNINC